MAAASAGGCSSSCLPGSWRSARCGQRTCRSPFWSKPQNVCTGSSGHRPFWLVVATRAHRRSGPSAWSRGQEKNKRHRVSGVLSGALRFEKFELSARSMPMPTVGDEQSDEDGGASLILHRFSRFQRHPNTCNTPTNTCTKSQWLTPTRTVCVCVCVNRFSTIKNLTIPTTLSGSRFQQKLLNLDRLEK